MFENERSSARPTLGALLVLAVLFGMVLAPSLHPLLHHDDTEDLSHNEDCAFCKLLDQRTACPQIEYCDNLELPRFTTGSFLDTTPPALPCSTADSPPRAPPFSSDPNRLRSSR